MAWREVRCAVLTAVALLAAGCPAPTGRTRGRTSIPDGGPMCHATTSPQNGQACGSAGDLCDAIRPCPERPDALRVDTCECLGGVWSCSLGVCTQPREDGGPVECPLAPVRDDDACGTRQGGLVCPGIGRGCDGSMISAPCWCTGSRWSCQSPLCDAGPADGPVCTDGISDGLACPPEAVGATCEGTAVDCEGFTVPTRCDCTSGRWSCAEPFCNDAGTLDAALDATTSGG